MLSLHLRQRKRFPGTKVNAPLVGTVICGAVAGGTALYRSRAVGQKKGDTLFIIEAMKTMNEIASPCDGTVSRVMVQSGDMVVVPVLCRHRIRRN